ncbi:alpha/beta fold hydrolase [Loktanella sp. R86503]|uniref:alpha/beta fold hydrolase n=1 Tax=Loktanella sp. R86503 TaxID=3093847 RepID=UPI0036D870F9
MMVAAFILGLLAVFACLPIYYESRRQLVSDADRRAAPGQMVILTQGQTYIRWYGPVRGPIIVAVHGLTTPSQVYDALAEKLGTLGYRVLAYDLYGRGLSDAVRGPQDTAFFLRQLDDVLTDQNIGDDVTLMGYSMGGAIVSAFAAAQPHRVGRLVLLASAGLRINESRFWQIARRVPVFGDWLVGAFGANRVLAEIEPGNPLEQMQRAQLNRRGYLAAVLSSHRHFLSESQEDAIRTVGREDIPVTAIWGGLDRVVPLQALGLLAQWNRNAIQDVVPGAGHALPRSHATEVVNILRQKD